MGFYTTEFSSSNNKDQLKVFWYVPESPKYLIHVIHGMIDHMGRYEAFGKWCLDHDILMVGFDVLGHGESVKSDLYWGSFGSEQGLETVVQDLTNFHFYLKETYPNLPMFMLGHSMGSMWLRLFISMVDTSNLSGVLLSGTTSTPLAVSKVAKTLAQSIKKTKGPWETSRLLEKLTLGNYNHHFEPVKTHLDWLSRDEEYVAKVALDPKSNFHFKVAGYVDLFRLMERIASTKSLETIDQNLPIFIFSGTKDYVAQDEAALVKKLIQQYQNQGFNVSYKLYEEGRHEMLNEINKEEVFTDILAFMKGA